MEIYDTISILQIRWKEQHSQIKLCQAIALLWLSRLYPHYMVRLVNRYRLLVANPYSVCNWICTEHLKTRIPQPIRIIMMITFRDSLELEHKIPFPNYLLVGMPTNQQTRDLIALLLLPSHFIFPPNNSDEHNTYWLGTFLLKTGSQFFVNLNSRIRRNVDHPILQLLGTETYVIGEQFS